MKTKYINIGRIRNERTTIRRRGADSIINVPYLKTVVLIGDKRYWFESVEEAEAFGDKYIKKEV